MKKLPEPDWAAPPAAPNCVTIFGGGIAGLTAAHELIERGFRVQVWEPQADPRHPHRGCDIGGMARTQWSRIPWADRKELDRFACGPGYDTGGMERAQPIMHLPQRFAVWYPWKDAVAEAELWPAGPEGDALSAFSLEGVCGFDVHIRDFERWDPARRKQRVAAVLQRVMEYVPGLQPSPQLAPRFDRKARVYTQDVGPCELVLLGDFPDGQHPDVFAVIQPWGENGEELPERYLLRCSRDVATNASGADEASGLDTSRIRGLSRGGMEKPAHEVLKELIIELLDNPQLDNLYIEVSDRFVGPDATLEERRTNAALNVFQELLDRATADFKPTEPTHLPYLEKAFLEPMQSPYQPRSAEGPLRWVTDGKLTFRFANDDSVAATLGPEERAASSAGIKAESRTVTLRIVVLDEFPDDFPGAPPEDLLLYIGFRVRERWLPGEHGYRFFPAFYHHLFDTMKRTPILEPANKSGFALAQERAFGISAPEPMRYVETGRTAFDNLRSTRSHVLAFSDGQRPSELSRARLKGVEELRRMMKVVLSERFGGFGVPPRDLSRLSLKVVEFLTSSRERRRQLERKSWWQFVDGDTYSPKMRHLLERWPEALVAMDAHAADATTHGVAMMQLLIDNFNPDGYRDGTLVAPTSEAWLNPWRRYLEAQGVEFIHGRLLDFTVVKAVPMEADPRPGVDRSSGMWAAAGGARQTVWPVVECYEPRFPRDADGGPQLAPGYVVLAVSADEAIGLAKKYVAAIDREGLEGAPRECSDLRKLVALGRSNQFFEGAQEQPRPHQRVFEDAKGTRDFRHYAGIQFYFAEDLYWVDGHVYHVDSPWGLTSISQARFWQERTDWEHGYRGVLSVVIGSWDVPGLQGKPAWQCDPQSLAEEVWEQIKLGLPRQRERSRPDEEHPGSGTLGGEDVPEPLFWRLDERLHWNGKQYDNDTPFFISTPDGIEERPGNPEVGYTIEHGIVCAGMHCRTFSRIPSMEAANESARHAVNAILRAQDASTKKYRRAMCDIWDPADREVDDLQFARDLDARLHERGLPHAMELFEVDRVAATILRGGPHDPFDPLAITTAASRWWRRFAIGKPR